MPSRTSFPKASAKVRTFSRPAKFFRDFFQKKCIFAQTESKTHTRGAHGTPIYYCVRACESERTGPHHGKGGKGEKDENVVLICLGCLQKINRRFVIKDNEDNGGQLFLSRIGELENLGTPSLTLTL